MGKEGIVLKDKTNPPFLRWKAAHIPVPNQNISFILSDQARYYRKNGCLATTAWSQQHMKFPRIDLQV